MKLLILLFFLSFNLFATEVRQEIIPFLQNEKVEFYWTAPPGNGPYPVYIYVYPFQGNYKGGATPFVNSGMLTKIANDNYVAVVFSQAGQGLSSGAQDHCGIISQAGLIAVIRHLQKLPMVNPDKIILHGVSMGANLSALVAAQVPEIGGLILENGSYDIEALMVRLIHRSFSDDHWKKIYEVLESHTGNDPDRYEIRSALRYAHQIKAPTLILSGELDSFSLSHDSHRLHQAIRETGTGSNFVLFPHSGHGIDGQIKRPVIENFLDKIR